MMIIAICAIGIRATQLILEDSHVEVRQPPPIETTVSTDQKYDWLVDPQLELFWPPQGLKAEHGDGLLKVGRILPRCTQHRRYIGTIWSLQPNGKLLYEWHSHFDAGGDFTEISAADLTLIPSLLKSLPKSNLSSEAVPRLIVAFPVNGVWEHRYYRLEAIPEEVDELMRVLQAKDFFPHKTE